MAEIYFATEKLKKDYEKLRWSSEFNRLHKFIRRAMHDIADQPDCGIAVPKRLIPKEYVRKYGAKNLYKYDLPDGWRLLYFLSREGVEIVAIILDWCSHKEYERIFKYRAR